MGRAYAQPLSGVRPCLSVPGAERMLTRTGEILVTFETVRPFDGFSAMDLQAFNTNVLRKSAITLCQSCVSGSFTNDANIFVSKIGTFSRFWDWAGRAMRLQCVQIWDSVPLSGLCPDLGQWARSGRRGNRGGAPPRSNLNYFALRDLENPEVGWR